MIASPSPWRQLARGTSLLGLSLWAAGCLSAPPPNLTYDREDTAGEVFRVFCRRVAKEAYPDDMSGQRFDPICDDGDPDELTLENEKGLRMLLRHREAILKTMQRAFGEEEGGNTPGVQSFADGELSHFLSALVPLYDEPQQTIPIATRGIANLLVQLLDPEDERARKVVDTVARLVKRQGYRQPEMNIGAIRAIATYDKLDTLASVLLPVVSTKILEDGSKETGAARGAFIELLNALALELADEPVATPNRDDSTLRHVIELALTEDEKQMSGNIDATWVLQRTETGDADGDLGVGTPFPVAGRDDSVERDNNGLAQSGGQPAFKAFDASKTLLAALMRETSVLFDRKGNERGPLESFAHGIKPLLGPWGNQSLTIGKNNYSFAGPDIAKSPLMNLAHIAAVMARYPETQTLIRALDQLLQTKESDATAVVYAALRINERSDEYPDAKLEGPHEFWDDLTAAAVRMGTRPGLFEELIRSFTKPESAAQGKLFATWMRYGGKITYPDAPSTDREDVNKDVSQKFEERVDRQQPDVGYNRSIWQRSMSLINSLNGQKVCNKKGGFLKANTGIGELYFPAFNGAGYNECELVEIADALEIYSQAVIGEAKIGIKDSFADLLAAFGAATGISGSVGEIQEKESEIKDFGTEPTPRALARFIFAPPNEWVTNLFDPQKTNEGVNANEYETYGLFPLEVIDEKTPLAGKPSSFLEIGKPLIKAFEDKELRAGPPDPVTGKKAALTDGYMFGHLLSVMHKHWASRKGEGCPEVPDPEVPGCTQSVDKAGKYYSPQTNLVSYEELLAEAFDEEDFIGILHKATLALADIKVQDAATNQTVDGITALANFVQRAVTVDPTLKKWTGEASTQSNLGDIQVPVLAPIHIVADALKSFDDAFDAENTDERIDAWHAGRSDLVDQLLETDKNGDKYSLRDRTAYNIVHPVLLWVDKRIEAHRTAQDLDAWALGLPERLAKVLRHPITAGVVDLLDAFWPEKEASGEFDEVVTAMTDDVGHPEQFRAMLTAIADTVILLDRDDQLSPAIQFAALAIAPNAFQAIDGLEKPNADQSAAYAGVELAGGVVAELNNTDKNPFKKGDEPTSLSKLLNNAVLATGDERSALEILIDASADVNRPDETAQPEDPLTADEDRDVFEDVRLFLADDRQEKGSLERLYKVIQNRRIKR